VKTLVAPDKFKHALDAPAVAQTMANALRAVIPAAEIEICPLADGGEGTGPLLAGAIGAGERVAQVVDPRGRLCSARWWHDATQGLGIIEMAEASGLALLAASERDALAATSYGTGQLLQAALDAGCRTIWLCIGGSATVDGGAGCLQALGWRLLDRQGREIREPACGGMLARIARVEDKPSFRASAATEESGRRLEVLCDVDNPLLGPRGAAPVFGPQKGASPEGVRQLEAGLLHWAGALAACTGHDVRDLPGGGAAGGIGAALCATLGAHIVPGFERVAERLGLQRRMAGCDLVVTGEGRLDEQTRGGKVVAGVAQAAGTLGIPVVAFVGAVETLAGHARENLANALGLRDVVVITPPDTPLEMALRDTAHNLATGVTSYFASQAGHQLQ
jgi:glycerate 2-kinase